MGTSKFISCLVVLAVITSIARPAGAYVVVAPAMPVSFGHLHYRFEERIEVNNQYFELSVDGLREMCRRQPDLCRAPAQDDQLSSMKTHDVVGQILTATGFLALVAGLVWSSTSLIRANSESDLNLTPLFVGGGLGLVLPIVGGFIRPSRSDLVDFVNDTNALHQKSPIRLQLGGGGGPQMRGFAIGLGF